MSDFSFSDPAIEVAAASPRFELIESKLRAGGLRPYAAVFPFDPGATDPLLIDVATASREILDAAARLAAAPSPRQIILLDIAAPRAPTANDAVILHRDRDLLALKSRLTALARRASRRIEAGIRRDSASAFGVVPAPADTASAPSLLYIGEGSPLFLSLQSPVKKRGIDLKAAISQDTARLYMAERRFTAALIDLDTFRADGSGIARWITEDHGLAALPIVALTHPNLHLTPRQMAAISLSTELVDAGGPTAEIAATIETVCRRLAISAPTLPGAAYGEALTDTFTGLFNRRFLEAHMARQIAIAAQRAEPLSLLTFRFEPQLATSRDANEAFARLVIAEMRDADCPALYQPGVFVISLAATPYRGGVHLAERISAAAVDELGFDLSAFGWRVIEKRAYHSPQTLIGASLIGPLMRPRIAA